MLSLSRPQVRSHPNEGLLRDGATVLHLVGLNHEKLTYRYSDRDFRLTDVAGVVATKIFS
jgi:hypothetical protein